MPSIEEMDVDGNGLISRQEFEDTMGDERHLLARAAKNGGFILFLVILVRLQGFFLFHFKGVFRYYIILYYVILYTHLLYTYTLCMCFCVCYIALFPVPGSGGMIIPMN